MTIASMTKGCSVVVQTQSVAASFGEPTYADGDTLECNVQEMTAQEAARFDSSGGERSFFNVFFGEDPSLSRRNRLKLTVRDNETLTTPVILRVLGVVSEGRPGRTLLWYANCEEVTARREG